MLRHKFIEALPLQGVKSDRIPVLPGGIAIMSAIMDTLGIQQVSYADGALRLGVLYDLLGRFHHHDMRSATVRHFQRAVLRVEYRPGRARCRYGDNDFYGTHGVETAQSGRAGTRSAVRAFGRPVYMRWGCRLPIVVTTSMVPIFWVTLICRVFPRWTRLVWRYWCCVIAVS